MHVVVTGSSGRLGRSVCAGLAASGHTVVGAEFAGNGRGAAGVAFVSPALLVSANLAAGRYLVGKARRPVGEHGQRRRDQ